MRFEKLDLTVRKDDNKWAVQDGAGMSVEPREMMKKIKEKLLALHRDDRGAMSVEKILILLAISIPIILALIVFRGKIVQAFNTNSQQTLQ